MLSRRELRGYSCTLVVHCRHSREGGNPREPRRHGKLPYKNALFAGHDEGAAGWGRIASLIETCKMNSVESYAWLKSTLEKIAGGHPQSRIRELLPWNFDPASS